MGLIIRIEVEGDMYDTRIQGGILADGTSSTTTY
jgi:hypothetical protein